MPQTLWPKYPFRRSVPIQRPTLAQLRDDTGPATATHRDHTPTPAEVRAIAANLDEPEWERVRGLLLKAGIPATEIRELSIPAIAVVLGEPAEDSMEPQPANVESRSRNGRPKGTKDLSLPKWKKKARQLKDRGLLDREVLAALKELGCERARPTINGWLNESIP